MNEVFFGVAGFPPNFWKSEFRNDRINVFKWLKSINLDLLELQMTYGPRMKPENAIKYGELSIENNIKLSIHASYFISLGSPQAQKVEQSYRTLEKTCELAQLCNVTRIIFHPGSVYGDSECTLERFIHRLSHFCNNYLPDNIVLYPETAGKRKQLGSEDEIIEICKRIPKCMPCFDFGHLRAYNKRGWDKIEDFLKSFEKIQTKLGKQALNKLHAHITPIEYGAGGEIRHRAYGESRKEDKDLFDYYEPFLPKPEFLAKAISEKNIPCWIVSECHDSQDEGAIAMKKLYLQIENEKNN